MSDNAKFERFNNLVALLLETRIALTVDEILDKVPGYDGTGDSARRMFERDKAELRELGIPLVAESLDPLSDVEDAYRIHHDEYYLPELDLTDEERAALHVAVSAVRFEEEDALQALFKLGGLEGAGGERLAALASAPELGHLVDALHRRLQVAFTYRGAERTVDPWVLTFKRGHWYLTGFDHLRGEQRNYRVDRIEDEVTASDEPAALPPEDTDLTDIEVDDPWRFGDEDPVSARVLLDAVVAAAEPDDRVVERRKDGSVVVEFPVTSRDAFRSYILGYLDRAVVLEPAEIRDGIIEWLTDLSDVAEPTARGSADGGGVR